MIGTVSRQCLECSEIIKIKEEVLSREQKLRKPLQKKKRSLPFDFTELAEGEYSLGNT